MPGERLEPVLIISGRSPHAMHVLDYYLAHLSRHRVHVILETPPFWGKFWKFARNRYRRYGLLSALDAFSFAAVQRLPNLFDKLADLKAEYFEVDDVNSERCAQEIRRIAPRIIVLNICSLLSAKTISEANCEIINVHNGINPRYRGAGNTWALAEDNPDLAGVTLHHVDAGIDTGKIISRKLLDPVKNCFTLGDIDREAFLAGGQLALAYINGDPSVDEVRRPLIDRFYPAAGLSTWYRARRNYHRRLRLGASGKDYDRAWHKKFETLSTTDGLSDAQRLMWFDDSTVDARDTLALQLLDKYRQHSWMVLDIGCGDGRYAKHIGAGYVGCDYSQGAMSLGKMNAGAFVLATADNLPFDDNTFDASIAVGLLQHVYSAQKIIDEMVRVTAIGGVIVINTLRLPSAIELAGFALSRPTRANLELALAILLRRFSAASNVAKRYRPKDVVKMLGIRGQMLQTRYNGVFGTRFLAREFTVACRRVATRKELADSQRR